MPQDIHNTDIKSDNNHVYAYITFAIPEINFLVKLSTAKIQKLHSHAAAVNEQCSHS